MTDIITRLGDFLHRLEINLTYDLLINHIQCPDAENKYFIYLDKLVIYLVERDYLDELLFIYEPLPRTAKSLENPDYIDKSIIHNSLKYINYVLNHRHVDVMYIFTRSVLLHNFRLAKGLSKHVNRYNQLFSIIKDMVCTIDYDAVEFMFDCFGKEDYFIYNIAYRLDSCHYFTSRFRYLLWLYFPMLVCNYDTTKYIKKMYVTRMICRLCEILKNGINANLPCLELLDYQKTIHDIAEYF